MIASGLPELAIDDEGVVHDLGWYSGRARCGAKLPDDSQFATRPPARACAACATFRNGREIAITWEVDPIAAELDYVRVWPLMERRRQGRPRWRFHTFELLGWSELGRGAPAHYGYFHRRAFVLMPHDRRPGVPGEHYRPNGAPAEAVDPRTLAPNVPGFRTARTWGEAW